MGRKQRRHDLSGQTFGRLTVLDFAGLRGRMTTWKVRCVCGAEFDIFAVCLKAGQEKCVNCPKRTPEISGDIVRIPLTKEMWTVVNKDDFDRLELLRRSWLAQYTGFRTTYYAARRVGKEYLFMHRVIMGATPSEEVDHINHDTLDNRRSNLRKCSHAQNGSNVSIRATGKTSRYKGVYWNKARGIWCAQVYRDGKKHYLGRFDTEEEAAQVYDEKALELFGEFALLNFTG